MQFQTKIWKYKIKIENKKYENMKLDESEPVKITTNKNIMKNT